MRTRIWRDAYGSIAYVTPTLDGYDVEVRRGKRTSRKTCSTMAATLAYMNARGFCWTEVAR